MADLLKWGKDRLKQAKGVYHQANMWDDGRTYDTNQRAVAPGTPNPVNMRSDDNPGFQWSNNSLTRGASRAWDQANPLDSGRSWKTRAASQAMANTSAGQQAYRSLIEPAFVTPVQHSANTLAALSAGVIGLGNVGKESLFGTDESYQNSIDATQGAMNELLDHGWGNKGGFGSSAEMENASLFGNAEQRGNFLRPVTRGVAEVAPLVVPGVGGVVSKGASLPIRAAVMGGENAVIGGATNAGMQYAETGKVDPRQVFKAAAISAPVGAAFPVAGSLFRGAVSKAPVVAGAMNVASRHPAVLELDSTLTRLNEQRGNLLSRGMSEGAPALRQNAKAYAMAVAEKQRVLQSIKEGGYVQLPGKGKTPDVPEPTNGPLGHISGDEVSKQAEANTLMEFIASPYSTPKDVAIAKARMQELAGDAPVAKPKPSVDKRTPLKSILGDERGSIQLPGKKSPKEVTTPGQNLVDSSSPQVLTGKGAKLTPDQGPVPLRQAAESVSDSTPRPPTALNVDKFNVSKKVKKAITETTDEMKPFIEAKTGTRLSNKEVRELSRSTGEVLGNAKTREATKTYLGKLDKLREQNAFLAEKRASGTITDAELKTLRRGILEQKAAATDAGRTFQAHKMMADPRHANILDVMTERIQKQSDDLTGLQEALDNLPKNPSQKELTQFYRQFVKATKEDWLDKFRYTNMLSSPLTHIVNVTSNLSGVAGISPVQKLFEGATDATRAVLTKSDRKMYAGEAGAYLKGVKASAPEAWAKFKSVMKGQEITTNPDMDALRNVPLAQGGAKGAADAVLSFVPKLLEASDQFATTLSTSGEKAGLRYRAGKGVQMTAAQIDNLADDAAKYRVFRQELGKQGQGHLLDMVDFIPQTVRKARASKNPITRNIAKFTFPFINTPTNLFKQGIEYSPLGITTLYGNANKTQAAAKALMGTGVVTLAGASLAAGGDLTFGEPTDSKQRDAFRAEGKQPYAIKIGGKWIGYSKTHPAIAFNLAMVAAAKQAQDENSMTDSQLDKFLQTGSGLLGYFRDQSYMKSVGDMTSIMQAKDGAKFQDIIANQATNTANQLVPFKTMQSWIGRQIDPTQRKVDYDTSTPEQIWQGLVKDIPGLNKNVPARINPYTGENLKNDNPILNSFSPLRVTNDKGFGNTTGLNVQQREQNRDLPADQREVFRRGIIEEKEVTRANNKEKADLKKEAETGQVGKTQSASSVPEVKQYKSNGKYYATIDGEVKNFDNKEKAEEAVTVAKFKSGSDKIKLVGNKYYIKNDSEQGYTTKSKVQYDYDQVDSKTNLDMDRAKASDDLEAWATSAGAKYEAMSKLRDSYDKETEQDKINDITKKMEDLQDTADKYADYGGFKKGSAGKKGKKGFQAPDGGGISMVGKSADNRALITGVGVKVARMRRKF